jgi:uncharacterized protein (DUF111 family)
VCSSDLFEQPEMRLLRIGIGAGQHEFAWPNVARLWLGEPLADGPMVLLETNIDDMNPQLYAAASEKLFAAGARDVWITPIQMKKNRPGVLLSVLASAALEQTLTDIILRETTTLGVRVQPVQRHEAWREIHPIETPYGTVNVKLKRVGDEWLGAMPEYDDCKRLAEAHGVPTRLVYEAALTTAHQVFQIGCRSDRLPK